MSTLALRYLKLILWREREFDSTVSFLAMLENANIKINVDSWSDVPLAKQESFRSVEIFAEMSRGLRDAPKYFVDALCEIFDQDLILYIFFSETAFIEIEIKMPGLGRMLNQLHYSKQKK